MSPIAEHLHVLLSTLTFVILFVVAIQASLFMMQVKLLRHRAHRIHAYLPSLESIERSLFYCLFIAFVALTLTVVSSLVAFSSPWTTVLLQKLLLSFIAWSVFLILLIRRYCLGWRGKIAVPWIFVGVSLVFIIYFATFLYFSFFSIHPSAVTSFSEVRG